MIAEILKIYNPGNLKSMSKNSKIWIFNSARDENGPFLAIFDFLRDLEGVSTLIFWSFYGDSTFYLAP